jgi:peptide deformylase
MVKILKRTKFGNPILREKARLLSDEEILSDEIQHLIKDIKYTCVKKQYGVGYAAPQGGVSVALMVVAIKPTPTRPNRELFDRIVINPEILEFIGKRQRMWEGCISFGLGNDTPYGETWRYKQIKVRYKNEKAETITETLTGLPAHVFQHETDHLNGIIFVDRLTSPSTLVAASEFRKYILPKLPKE